MSFRIIFRISAETPDWKRNAFSFTVKLILTIPNKVYSDRNDEILFQV